MGRSGQVDLAALARDCVTLVGKHPEMGIGVRILERAWTGRSGFRETRTSFTGPSSTWS